MLLESNSVQTDTDRYLMQPGMKGCEACNRCGQHLSALSGLIDSLSSMEYLSPIDVAGRSTRDDPGRIDRTTNGVYQGRIAIKLKAPRLSEAPPEDVSNGRDAVC